MKESTAKQLLEKVKSDYTEIAEDFDMTRRCNWQDFSVFDEYLKDGLNVLDIGCGNGRLMDYLKQKAQVDYYGVDNNEKFIEIAKKRAASFKVGDFLSLPYPDSGFDLVLSVAAFHHIPSEEFRLKALHEVARIMKPGTYGIFLVWNLWQRKYFFAFIKSLLRFFVSFGKYSR
ncbi:MAG: class I SAM-dependent methyltransferase, partial [Candidatus Gracilibacteria bacterium]